MTQQAEDSTPNPLLDQLDLEFADELKIYLDETAEREREEEREHHELREHDYDDPKTGYEFDYVRNILPPPDPAHPAPAVAKPLPSVLPPPTSQKTLQHVRLSDVTEEEIPWLWEHYIPLGGITILDGDPGLGKTTIAMDLMARVSQGSPMPFCDEPRLGASNCLIVSAEDSITYTLTPRARVAGADMARLFSTVEFFTLPTNMDKLRKTVEETKARLIVIDPGIAFLDQNVNPYSDADMRRVLAGLAQIAGHTESAVIFIRHLNKDKSNNPMYRGGGSIAVAAAARSCLIAKMPARRGGRRKKGEPKPEVTPVLASYKTNLGVLPSSLSYRIVSDQACPTVGKVEWLAEITMTASEALEGDLPPSDRLSPQESFEEELGREEPEEPRPDVYTTLLTNDKPEGLTRSELQILTRRGAPRIKAELEELAKAGRIVTVVRTHEGAGRPGTAWRAVLATERPAERS